MAAAVQLPEIADLRILGVMGRGAHATVYHATHGGRDYALTVLEPAAADAGDRERLARRRGATLARARHASLPRIVSVGQSGPFTYLATELVEGRSLASVVDEGPLAEADVVRIGCDLAGGLAEMHRLGIVHGGISIANVVLDDSGGAKLVALGLDGDPSSSRGDARSDLYALGALLFDCAAGQSAATAGGEPGFAYGGRSPAVRDLNPNVSPMLSAVIIKLLSEDPAQRYQSAVELLEDLSLVPLPNGGPRAPEAGVSDPIDGLLAGRRAELARLRAAWEDALRERGQLVVLRGPVGSGKTHLARHFLNEVRDGGRLALIGRCDAEAAVPFGALRMALETWLGHLAQLGAPHRLLAEQRLRIAAGDFAGLLKLFSPEFDRVFEVPAAPESELLHERFYDILSEFLLKLAGCYGGLALCLDDVQWLDTSTREVLRRMAGRLQGAPLLVLGTTRSDHQSRSSQPEEAAPELPSLPPRVDVTLAPLTEAAIGRIVAALLNVRSVSQEITQHIASWTSGNPLAVVEYVDALINAGVLRPEWGQWEMETEGLEHLELPRDVGQLLAIRVQHLSPATREVLALGSLTDGPVRVGLLAAVAGSETGARQALAEAVEANIVRPSGAGAYEFSHNRVRQAFTAELPAEVVKDLHQRIGDALVRLPADDSPRIFARARHCWLGHPEHDWRQVYDTSLAAGLAAMRSFADAEAYDFLKHAQTAASAGGFPPAPTLDAALGDVCIRTGIWDEALVFLNRAIEGTTDSLTRAGLLARVARVYVANRDTDRAWAELDRGFREIGTPIGRGPVARSLYSVCCWVLGLLALRLRWGYGMAPEAFRPRLRMLSQLYVTGAYVAYLMNDSLGVLEMVVRQLHTGHLLGDSTEMASALTSYANVMAMLGRRTAAKAYSTRSMAMVARLGDRFQLARMRMFDAFQRHVAGMPRRGELAMRRCLQLDGTWLDGADFAYAHIDLAWNLMLRGYVSDSLSYIEAGLAKAQPNSGASHNLEIKAAAALAVLGRTSEAHDRLSRIPQPAGGQGWLSQGYFSFLVLVLMEQGQLGRELDDALQAYRECAPTRAWRTSFHGRHFFVFQGYARLEQHMREPTKAHLRLLRQAVSEMRHMKHHPTLDSHYLALKGAVVRLRGKPRRALTALLSAQSMALRADNVWAQFHIHRQLAHTLAELGNYEAALRQAHEAYRLASGQGWQGRARLIRSEFASLRPNPEHAADARPLLVDAGGDPERLKQHLEALLQVSLAASTTLDPGRQAQVALDELLRVLQAQRAFLFTLTPYGDLQLRAGRSAAGEDLPDLTGYSRSVVESVRTSGEPVIAGSADQAEIESVDGSGHDTRSILAAPVLMKGDLLGVVYVDCPLTSGVFTEEDVRILLAIANHIAIALQNASTVAQQTALTRANSDLLEALRLRVAELQDSRRQITAAEERLRREIAEMLHSRVQSKLLVAAHQLGQATALLDHDTAEARRLLELSQEQLDDVREREIREASHLLHPSIIKIGLGPAVRSLIGRFEGVFEVSLEVDPRIAKLDGIVDNQLPEELRLTAYRVVEEAMSNAARHAHATHLDVSLRLTNARELALTIKDDGVGFDGGQLRPGLGLSSIAGRVNQLGGAWRLSGEPGQGARVEVVLPL